MHGVLKNGYLVFNSCDSFTYQTYPYIFYYRQIWKKLNKKSRKNEIFYSFCLITLPIVSFGSEEESEVLAYAKDVVGTENERHVYDVTRQDLDHTNGSYYDYLYQVVRIGGLSDGALVPTGGYNNDNPGENGYTLYVTGRDDSYSFNISVPFDYRTDDGELITDYSWFVGKKLIITGAYSFYIYNGRTNYIITVGSNADFEFAA